MFEHHSDVHKVMNNDTLPGLAAFSRYVVGSMNFVRHGHIELYKIRVNKQSVFLLCSIK